jgi:hypothetical protein
MSPIEIALRRDSTTKNTVRYEETEAAARVGTVYVLAECAAALGHPDRLILTLTTESPTAPATGMALVLEREKATKNKVRFCQVGHATHVRPIYVRNETLRQLGDPARLHASLSAAVPLAQAA